MLAHFISAPRVRSYDATTVLLSVFEGKGLAATLPERLLIVDGDSTAWRLKAKEPANRTR
jgi:hypothetical protein